MLIEKPRDEDLGQYQCFAENEHGVATSNSVFVRKSELNSFKDEPPQTKIANEGSPFHLTCIPPDGWPKPTLYWMRVLTRDRSASVINDPRITIDPEGHLWFSNVTRADKSDNFHYACGASIKTRFEYKIGNFIMLDVIPTGISAAQNRHEPIKQYVSRKNEVALRERSVKLYCIYGGTPLPQTVWKKNNDSIQLSERVTQGNYGKSLEIQHLTFEDRGTYTCEVSNGVGRAQSYSISLDVNSIPYFEIEPEMQTAAEDETVEFKCVAKGKPEPKISWIHNGKPIDQAPVNNRRSVTSDTIVIRGLKLTDTGNYGCNATNTFGYVYKDFSLNVLALPPEIKNPPKEVATVDGRNVTLTCNVIGAPKPIVKWIRNALELTGGRYYVQESGDLLIENVGFVDEGGYTCHASNKFGSVNASGTLIVKKHTRITDEPQDYEVPAGQSATFRCNAVSDSALEMVITWLRKGEEIDFETQPGFVMSNDNSLTISKTTELDSGTYTCTASTELDTTSANATLIVQDVPNRPRLVSTRCNVQDSAISWEPLGDNRSPILHYTIQYNTSFTPDTWEVAFEKVPSTDSSFTVSMSPWANYTFRVIAINKIGPSLPSEHGEVCTTQSDVPYKNPDNVEGKGTEPTNLIISWTHMPEIEHNAPHFQYRVYWKRDIPAEKWETQDIFDWEQSSLLIRDQPTFQKYRIKVVAINENGESSQAAKEVIGYSGEDKPTQAPTNFTLVSVTDSTSALLSWNPVPLESVNGHFKGYKIQTWTEADGDDQLREIHVQGDSSRALVTKFTPNSKNFARVMVYNSRYNGPASAVIDFWSPEGVPSSVQSFDAKPWGSSAFQLSWKRPLHPNGNLTGYKIYYEQVNGTRLENKQEREPHIDDPRQLQCKLAGLQPNTKYRLHITATTRAGEGEE